VGLSHTFIFLVTEGTLESEWCIKELLAGLRARRPLLLLRDVNIGAQAPTFESWTTGPIARLASVQELSHVSDFTTPRVFELTSDTKMIEF
jgi:hypothetical protein